MAHLLGDLLREHAFDFHPEDAQGTFEHVSEREAICQEGGWAVTRVGETELLQDLAEIVRVCRANVRAIYQRSQASWCNTSRCWS